MAKGGGKIFGISTTLLLTGLIIVAILVGTGVIKIPLTERMTSDVCTVPTLNSATLLSNGKIRVSFTPISQECGSSKALWVVGADCGRCGGGGGAITVTSGQTYLDMDGPPSGNNCNCSVGIVMYPDGHQSENYQATNKVSVTVP